MTRPSNFGKHNLTLEQKLEGRWIFDPETDCHVWQYALTDGYAVMRFEGRNWYVHVLVYEAKKGPIGKGLQLDHACRNRACINVDHLEEVTSKENTRRGKGAGRTRLTPREVAAMREAKGSCRAIAEQFGIGPSHVSRIKRNLVERWEDV